MKDLKVLYDGTFEGLLTAMFFAVHDKREITICKEPNNQPNLFETTASIVTDELKSASLLHQLHSKLSSVSFNSFYCCYLSELPGIENSMLYFLKHIFNSKQSAETDFSNIHVLKVAQVAKMVHREKHRMEAFIRFRLLNSQLYYAAIEPDFDVLPLINRHFTKRYADQQWIIYDLKRNYGLYYDLSTTKTMEIDFNDGVDEGKNIQAIIADDEMVYENLWKVYFKNVNIPERKNMKLHLRHVPRRYWKYLSEKQLQF